MNFIFFFAVILVISSVATAAGAWGLITDNQHVSIYTEKNQLNYFHMQETQEQKLSVKTS